ncbi:MAG: transglycosylase SLT domain-containing protein, partial [Pyrinomonadaceae bacterium]
TDGGLQKYYLELVERVYRLEVGSRSDGSTRQQILASNQSTTREAGKTLSQPSSPDVQIGFRNQTFEPSPLDELSRLKLTPGEQLVTSQDEADLELASGAINFPFKPNPLIQQYINYYQGRGHNTMEAGLRRSGRFMKMARRIFREEGVPEDVAWLGQIESSWNPRAYSHAAASGLWQFIRDTGSRFGLRQTAWLDERNSLEKATRASARYLKWLANRYNGNWELALGAYNTGENRIDRAITRVGAADFWQIYPFILSETRNYVPNILATILIAKNPSKYGFANVTPEPSVSYDTVRISGETSLHFAADAAGTSVDYLRTLNPELRRDLTPRDEEYDLRVPPGQGKQLLALLKRVPVDRRNSVQLVSVSAGEDLSSIANRTGTSVAQLQLLNPGIEAKPGVKLVLPGSIIRTSKISRSPSPAAASSSTSVRLIKVWAVRDDTLGRIASRYGVSVSDLARLNGISPRASLRKGQEIRVTTSESRHSAVRHIKSSHSRRRR